MGRVNPRRVRLVFSAPGHDASLLTVHLAVSGGNDSVFFDRVGGGAVGDPMRCAGHT